MCAGYVFRVRMELHAMSACLCLVSEDPPSFVVRVVLVPHCWIVENINTVWRVDVVRSRSDEPVVPPHLDRLPCHGVSPVRMSAETDRHVTPHVLCVHPYRPDNPAVRTEERFAAKDRHA